MFTPSPLPRNLEASFRDVGSGRAPTRVSAVRDVVRHASRSDATRARAVPVLERVLREDDASEVRAQAALALADLGAHEALPALLLAIEDSDARVRQMAVSALGEIGDRRARGRLERALDDERPEVRYQAVMAFARVAMEDPEAVAAALVRALDDADSAIRYVAMRMAEELAVDGRGLHDVRLAARAEQLVDGADEAVAVAAGLYLAGLGRERGWRVVSAVVSGAAHTPEIEDEQACVELCGEMGREAPVADLERRAWGRRRVIRSLFAWGAGDRSSCAWHARIALARLGHARARAEILRELGSSKRETREGAVVAAGRARLLESRPMLEQLEGSVDAELLREAFARLAVS